LEAHYQESSMAVEVVLPMLGITVEKGKILKWFKCEGDSVRKGEIIFEVETDKVVTEVEAPATGILAKILIPVEVEVPVLTVVGVIIERGESLPEQYLLGARTGSAQSLPASSPGEPPGSPGQAAHHASEPAYDIAILGAGPGGYVAAIRAAQLGARVALIERAELGGTCLNRGCIPTKSFLADVKTCKRVRESDLFLHGAAVSIDPRKMVARKDKVVETMRRGISRILESHKVSVIQGTACFNGPNRILVKGPKTSDELRARDIIVATGSRPATIANLPVDGKRVLSSDHVMDLRAIPRELVIIGGGVIGLEFATLFCGLGARVTVLEMLPQIVAGEDQEVIRGLTALLKKQGIEIHTQSRVLKTSPKGKRVEVAFEREKNEETVSAEKVLVAVGRTPCVEGLDLQEIGVRMDGRFVRVNGRMETNVDHVYAIGDVIGKMMLAHAASAEGIVAVENIMGIAREIDYGRIPSCMYTDPEVASVGLKEEEARRQGYDVGVGKFPYLSSGKALALGEPEGFVKIVAEKGLGRILGVQILGVHATDLIGEYLVAMHVEASIEDLGEVVKGHPTLSEALTEAALDWRGMAIHVPKETR
jgi:dihydrolipoamide dehydrogenase